MNPDRRTVLKGATLGLFGTDLVASATGDARGRSIESTSAAGIRSEPGKSVDAAATRARTGGQQFTPLVAEVRFAPIPFPGSDGRVHVVYELEVTNATSGETVIDSLSMLDADSGDIVETFDEKAIADRLQPVGFRETVETLAPSTTALVFLNVQFDDPADVPERLVHRLTMRATAAPPDLQRVTGEMGPVEVDRRDVVVVEPPLRGSRYIAADSCCDNARHRRAALPIDGTIRIAQRFAVDYERLDDEGRIWTGEKEALESYAIYGEDVFAVADGRAVKVIDGLAEQVPGRFPARIGLDEADGNSVILDIGDGTYVLYAHLQPGSVRVSEGDRVERGEVLGLVGNSGNSLAPHLHFHVMDGPLSLASNGLPYGLDSFSTLGTTPGTDAFDAAEADGTPLDVTWFDDPEPVRNALPLDQLVVRFDDRCR